MVPIALADRQRDGQSHGRLHYWVVLKRIVAWDYGSLREVPTPPGTSAPRQASFSVTDEKDDVHPFHSPNLEAAVRRSRVMILASRSQKKARHHSRYRCGWFLTTAASMPRPRRRPGRYVMWLLPRRWPYCSAARVGTTPTGSSCADAPERSEARHRQRCSLGQRGSTTCNHSARR